jgi:hypothetical protein
MAGTDITRLLEAIQKKIDAVDSSASSGDLLRLLSSVRQAGTGSLLSYDNEIQLPNLLDGTPDPGMIAYNLAGNKLYFQKGSWIGKEIPNPFQGSNYGYISGANAGGGGDDRIDKYPFSSDDNSTDVGNLSVGRWNCSGQSSATHGYTAGGNTGHAYGGPVDTIDKFPFTSGFTTATDVGNLTAVRTTTSGQSSIPNGYGYNTGGGNVIEKFSFTSDGNSTSVGNTLTSREYATGQSSATHGYTSGNYPITTDIDKFPFSSDGNSTDVGDLTVGRGGNFGQSSATHGYTAGGYSPAGNDDPIDKFSFTSDGNATDVGDLSVARQNGAGSSSTTHGYSAGGYGPGTSNIIDKFPFSTDANATDVGDLTLGRYQGAGQQY